MSAVNTRGFDKFTENVDYGKPLHRFRFLASKTSLSFNFISPELVEGCSCVVTLFVLLLSLLEL